ncbi:LPXTG-site transpeptidase (sortase) family protein [Amycolatopsis sulphurea]|uniref:LPXTG-site transpeptidase (Sortase) family protein n=1 Tax=Amycolatopsis sulphurea TaxID=76022 RepID=A0A2A9FCW9_9PSEU|nr:class E sortase [Amycolatopsis sulphurea]PFG48279.1 LPXTG-site transpeptidase (sortase) family protein [Amycolatopsis sulphurea]
MTSPGADQPTEVIPAVSATAVAEKKPPPPLGKGGLVIRTAGELFITLGLIVLLFMVYEVWVTDLFSAEKQSEASDQLDGDWAKDRTLHPELVDGKAFARIHIPSFGADFNFTIQEGTGEDALAVGPGHYKGTALPGEPGNFGIAGHRVGKGAPFNDLDNLNSCDEIVIETHTDFYLYKVLPYDDEIKGWTSGKGAKPACKGVSTLRDSSVPGGGAYDQTVGRKIVLPSQGDAVNPVPYKPADALPKAQRASLLTLTTCHPKFSAKQRLIITSVLTQQVPKSQAKDYDTLLAKIGGAS